MPLFPTDPDRLNYTESPWTNPEDGRQWIYKPHDSVPMWWPYTAPGTALTWAKIEALADYPATFPADHAAATVTGNGISITGQQISLDIGTGATQVAAGDHSHALLDSATDAPTANTLAKRDANEGALFGYGTGHINGNYVKIGGATHPLSGAATDYVWSFSMSALDAERTWSMPNASGTIALTASATGVPDKLAFGSNTQAVSMSSVAGTATFTFGSAAKAAFASALGLGVSDNVTHATLTCSGAATADNVRITNGSGGGRVGYFTGGSWATFFTFLGGNAITTTATVTVGNLTTSGTVTAGGLVVGGGATINITGATGKSLVEAGTTLAAMNLLGVKTYARTTDATARTSASFAADDTLASMPVTSGKYYIFIVSLKYTSSTVGFQWKLVTPGHDGGINAHGVTVNDGGAVSNLYDGASSTDILAAASTTARTDRRWFGAGLFRATATGNCAIHWAPNTSGGSAQLLTGATVTLIELPT